MSTSESPELATNPEWCRRMRERREQEGWTQAELARRVGTSQKNISELEAGNQRSSAYVQAISDELGIPPPFIPISDDLELQWMRAGQALLAADRALFLIKLQEVSRMLGLFTPKA